MFDYVVEELKIINGSSVARLHVSQKINYHLTLHYTDIFYASEKQTKQGKGGIRREPDITCCRLAHREATKPDFDKTIRSSS